jgi:hypothetical protein
MYTQPGKQLVAAAALAIATLGGGLSGCATRAAPNEFPAKIAELREEIAALRSELGRLTAALEAAVAADAIPMPHAVAEAPADLPSAVTASSAAAAIAALLDEYRQALQTEDLQLVRAVYGGDPPAEDLRYLKIWFSRTDELQVDIDPRAIDVLDGNARAVVRQTMTYTLSRTQERRTAELTVRMQFERRGDEWLLTRADARR